MRLNIKASHFHSSIVIPAVVVIAAYVIAFFFFIIPYIEKNTVARKKEMIVELTNSVVSIAREYYHDALNEPSRQNEFKQQAIETIEHIQYGSEDKGYFWMVDSEGVIIIHPHSQQYIGVPPEELPPHVAKVLFKITETVADSGKGFMEYYWQNTSFERKLMNKMAYVQVFEPWQWTIGTGIYLDDLYHEITEIKRNLNLVSGIITLIMLITFLVIIKRNLKSETEKQNAQNKLTDTMERFKVLFETANDALIILDKNLVITDCNNKLCELCGQSKETLLGCNPIIFTADVQPGGISATELVKLIEKENTHKNAHPIEWNIIGKNEELKYSWTTISKFTVQRELFYLLIIRDITERKHMEQQLLFATIHSEENERNRFARELHDGLGPVFSTVKLYFQWLAEESSEKKREEIITKGNENIEDAIRTLREISFNLSPHILNNFGLVTAIRKFIDTYSATGKIKINFTTNLDKKQIKEIEITLYRVITELINNTIKYAKAKNIDIMYKHNTVHNYLSLTYTDDGIGFDIDKAMNKTNGLGLYNIKSRIKTLGGETTISSKKNKGIQVSIKIFLNKTHEQPQNQQSKL